MAEGLGDSSEPVMEPTLSSHRKMRHFLVLMWKHLTVRKTRFIGTAFDLLSPCLFFILLAIMRPMLNPRTPFDDLNATEYRRQTVKYTETLQLQQVAEVPPLILYTPDSQLTESLMDEVGRRLNLVRLTSFPTRYSKGYYAFSNENVEPINNFIEDTTSPGIVGASKPTVVLFQDMDVEPWPKHLNYTIRMKTNFMTHTYQSLDEETGEAHEAFGTIYEPFMRLQWAIDSSYLSIISGDNVNQTITFQEFPSAIRYKTANIDNITTLLRSVCAFSLMLPFVYLLTRLVEERASGVQELIRMVGVSNSILAYSHFVNMIPTGLFYAIAGAIVLKVTDNPLVPKSDGFLIFLMLILHFFSIMALAFVCSYSAKSAQYSSTLAVICFMLSWLPTRLLDYYQAVPRPLMVLLGLLPHVPMSWFWNEVDVLERPGGALDWTTMWVSHSRRSGAAWLALLLQLLQTALLLKLAVYLSLVLPGKYGVALPWNFPLQRSYWSKKKVDPNSPLLESEEEAMPTKDPLYFEETVSDEVSPNHDVGIKISNVYKTYGKDIALSNVSFDVYKGEITVLLGHNGAGKTTLMSIITGMTSSDAGAVRLPAGGRVGLCPQHNIFFPDLSVLEHLMFFAMLKGNSYAEAKKSSKELLSRLGIEGKANSKSDELSGGMKRRLQLACALSGGACVLILDEPTSGLDVETRRELWNLLLSLRGDRTVLLTTHFMEEADALGDRVAVLHKGKLKCHATPMYLKKNIGTGYRLSLTTIGAPKEGAITGLISSVIPDCTPRAAPPGALAYSLPAHRSSQFPDLFTQLEENRSQLGIDSIGVGVTSLEEVFLKLCSDVDTKFTQETVDSTTPERTFLKKTGFPLYVRQTWVLMKRQMKYVLFKKTNFLLLQVLLPLMAIFFVTYTLNDVPEDERNRNKLTAMNLDMYKNIYKKKVLYNVLQEYESAMDKVKQVYKDVTFEPSDDIVGTLLQAAQDEDLGEYNKYLAGVELNGTEAKFLYTAMIRHAAPTALNLLSNLLAAHHLTWSDGRTVTTNNHPLDQGISINLHKYRMEEPKAVASCATWTVFVVSIIAGALTSAVTLPIKERMSGTRHIHVMSGCPPAVHWLATLLSHTLLYTVLLVLPTAAIAMVDKQMTLSQPTFIGSFIVILCLGSAAFLASCYLVTLGLSERGAGFLLTVLIIFLGLVPAMVETVSEMLKTQLGTWKIPVAIANYIFPAATMTSALFRATSVARSNGYCDLNLDKCPHILPSPLYRGLDVDQCCAQQKGTVCTLCMEDLAPGKQLIILAVQIVVYTLLVILSQYGLFNAVWDRLVNSRYRPPTPRFNDDMVRAENTYVSKGIQLPPKQIQDAMLVNDLHKNYFRLLKPRSPCNAVKGVSFSVKKGECFGLLGVNGAGKSTTFKMITGEECATRGGVFANGHHLKWPRSQYLQSLGYCPQFFGLDEFLTGRENLSLLLTLRGLSERDVNTQTEEWIKIVGLERYRDVLLEGYSGGCTRRLATVAALSAGAPLTLLDEPTAGVDVAARRPVWGALRAALRDNRALIITSHSMEEMEALCDRIALLCAGEACALGGAGALRARHAAGHALRLKLTATSHTGGDAVDSAMPEVQNLKESLHQKFNCSLKDEHKTMLHYHINETLRYSELFTALEQLKSEYPHLIEDYSVTETTLEEVFLSFAQPNSGHPVANDRGQNHPI